MPVYDCGNPLCESCRREFGPDRLAAIEGRRRRAEITRFRRDGAVIYDTISRSPVSFFSSDRDAQQCMTLMEAVAR